MAVSGSSSTGDEYSEGDDSSDGSSDASSTTEGVSGDDRSETKSAGSATSGGEAPEWTIGSSHEWVKSIPLKDEVRDHNFRIILPCAGWDSPSRALRALKIKHRVVGVWDTSASASRVLRALHGNLDREVLHLGPIDGDITQTDPGSLPDADCQMRTLLSPTSPPFAVSCDGYPPRR